MIQIRWIPVLLAMLVIPPLQAGDVTAYVVGGMGAKDPYQSGIGFGASIETRSPVAMFRSVYVGLQAILHSGSTEKIEVSSLGTVSLDVSVRYAGLEIAPVVAESPPFKFRMTSIIGVAGLTTDEVAAVGDKDAEIRERSETRFLFAPGVGVVFNYGPMFFGVEGRYLIISEFESAAVYGSCGVAF